MRGIFFFLLIGISFTLKSQIEFFGEVESLGLVNSQYDEKYIAIDPSSKLLILSRKNHPASVGEEYNPLDLWLSRYDSIWRSPSPSTNVHPDSYISPLGFIKETNIFAYNRSNVELGKVSGEIWIAEFDGNSFINSKKLSVPYFNSKSTHQSGSISADGKHILIAMEGTTSFGVEDLYVIHLKNDGTWTGPKNLGYRVNTPFQEFSPFIAADNETLVFASNGRGGEGSFDLFITQRIDNTWQNWTEPKNLGNVVNTKGAETSFVFNQGDEYAYFSSTTDSDGYGDIKRIRIQSDIESIEIDSVSFVLNDEIGFYTKVFTLKDMETDEIIKGEIMLKPLMSQFTSTPYEWKTESIEDINITVKAKGYVEYETLITSLELQAQDLIVIPLQPLNIGTTVELKNVLFYRGTANFIEGSQKELDLLVEMMQDNPNLEIQINGHTDNVGNAFLNQELSEERVKVVMEYLTDKGIDRKRFSGKGFGGSQPVAPNDTEENRRLNRRVEFTILKN